MGRKKGPQAIEASRVLGENLVDSRRRAGLSQEAVADRAGLHRTQVAFIELGKRLPRLDTIIKLAGAVEVQPCSLLEGVTWRLDAPEGQGSK